MLVKAQDIVEESVISVLHIQLRCLLALQLQCEDCNTTVPIVDKYVRCEVVTEKDDSPKLCR